jgi:predicted nucleic acid-binding Zn ribbon protein
MLRIKKHCLYCNSAIYGRADKKFCGDNCRSSYNNGRKKEIEDEVVIIRKTLMRNRRVISQLLKDGIESIKVSKDRMALMGYNFKYHTHHYHLHDSKSFWFCFEYGYLDLGGGKLLLLRDLGEKYLIKIG